jgi:hypothetical protein
MRKQGFTHESTHNESVEWYTPKHIFDALGMEFDMDVCSPGKGIVSWIPAKEHITFEKNGLLSRWSGTVWMNPPYGSDTPVWMHKLAEHGDGIAMVFARTDTAWFHESATRACAIMFIAKRVQFVASAQAESYGLGAKVKNSGSGAGSMLVAYGDKAFNGLLNAQLYGLGRVMTFPCI